jgi:hypothetical protein
MRDADRRGALSHYSTAFLIESFLYIKSFLRDNAGTVAHTFFADQRTAHSWLTTALGINDALLARKAYIAHLTDGKGKQFRLARERSYSVQEFSRALRSGFERLCAKLPRKERLLCSAETNLPLSLPHEAAKVLRKTARADTKEGSAVAERAALGMKFETYADELRHIAEAARSKRRHSYEQARRDFPDFEIWSVIDSSSSLSAKRRDQLFKNPSEFSKQPSRFSFIGELHNMAKDTAYDYFKDRPKTKRSRQR